MNHRARAQRITLAASLWAAVASAQAPEGLEAAEADREQARSLGYDGLTAYEAGRYAEAEQKLAQAYALLPAPSLGLWLARAVSAQGRWVEAERHYREVLALPPELGEARVQHEALSDARDEHEQLARMIPTLALSLRAGSWQGVRLSLDGRPLAFSAGQPLALDAGEHELLVERGADRGRQLLTLRAHDRQALQLELPSGASWRPYAYPVWTLGALGLGVGTLALAAASAEGDIMERVCSDEPDAAFDRDVVTACEERQRQSRKRYDTLTNVGIAGLIGMWGGGLMGLLLYFGSPRDSGSADAERVSAGLSLGGLGLVALGAATWSQITGRAREHEGDRCEPSCYGQQKAANARYITAGVSLGAGALALGAAAWILLSGEPADTIEFDQLDIDVQPQAGAGSLSWTRRF